MTGQILIMVLLTVISLFTTSLMVTLGSIATALALVVVVEGSQ